MKIQFLGAARNVPGSCFVIETEGRRFCIDCGMHQGNKAIEARNRDIEPYRPKDIDFVLLTHAHIDHSGLLPLMVKEGFNGPVYCTKATGELITLMLEDSGHIQEMEALFAAKKYARRGLRNPPAALYTVRDAQAVAPRIRLVSYHEDLEPCPGVRVRYYDAGHILGSASVRIEIDEGGRTTSLLFSGDIGRPNSLIVRDPETPSDLADYVFMESTYGDRNHRNVGSSEEELLEAIQYSHSRGGKVIIPAFAVERTQEILYTLHRLHSAGRIPSDMMVFVDSPLAIQATEIFRKHHDLMDDDAQAMLGRGEDPFELPNVRYTLSREDSTAINDYKGPAIIISSSGMCNAGRIKHHLMHNIWKDSTSVVFVGYQAVGTPGRTIVEGGRKLRLFGDDLTVRAKVFCINSFSAHAGMDQLLDWLAPLTANAPQVVLVHGEEKAQKHLAGLIKARYGIDAAIPSYLEEMELQGRSTEQTAKAEQAPMHVVSLHEDRAQPRINWDFLAGEIERKWLILREKLDNAHNISWVEQTELEEELSKMEYYLTRLIAKM